MKSALRSYATAAAAAAALIAVSTSWGWCQESPSDKQQAGKESIGDAVQAEDKAAPSDSRAVTGAMAQPVASPPPIHILYVHGINQVGAGDSIFLRKAICKYLGECTVTNLGRVYADGPFAVDSDPPRLALMGEHNMEIKGRMECIGTFH